MKTYQTQLTATTQLSYKEVEIQIGQDILIATMKISKTIEQFLRNFEGNDCNIKSYSQKGYMSC